MHEIANVNSGGLFPEILQGALEQAVVFQHGVQKHAAEMAEGTPGILVLDLFVLGLQRPQGVDLTDFADGLLVAAQHQDRPVAVFVLAKGFLGVIQRLDGIGQGSVL
jgi:hypothetical protein